MRKFLMRKVPIGITLFGGCRLNGGVLRHLFPSAKVTRKNLPVSIQPDFVDVTPHLVR
jgi:hypothetical protein